MNKTIGCTFVAAGAAIGAGTIALPIAVAGMGFSAAALILVGIWLLSWAAGLLTLEVNLAFKAPLNSYATMSQATLGKKGKWITYILFVIFLYALTSAYISGGSSLVQAGSRLIFDYVLPDWVNTVLYTLLLGSVIACSTRAVDLLNRGLFSIKTLLLIAVFVVFLPQVNVADLLSQHHWYYAAAGSPIIFSAFGSHLVIPSVAGYVNHDVKKLKIIVLFGSLIPLIVYLFWIACMLGVLPYYGENSLATIAGSSTQVESLMYALNARLQSPLMILVINLFSHIVIITSFLGCALSLFDFLRDKKLKSFAQHRGFTAILTFLPPLLVGLLYPDALVQILSFSVIFSSSILIILPALMAWRLRTMKSHYSPYRVPGGKSLILFVGIMGIAVIIAEVLRMTGFSPIWLGEKIL